MLGSATGDVAGHVAADVAGEESGAALQRACLVWELLHDGQFCLPSEDEEAAWSDAIGATSVMEVSQGLAKVELGFS